MDMLLHRLCDFTLCHTETANGTPTILFLASTNRQGRWIAQSSGVVMCCALCWWVTRVCANVHWRDLLVTIDVLVEIITATSTSTSPHAPPRSSAVLRSRSASRQARHTYYSYDAYICFPALRCRFRCRFRSRSVTVSVKTVSVPAVLYAVAGAFGAAVARQVQEAGRRVPAQKSGRSSRRPGYGRYGKTEK